MNAGKEVVVDLISCEAVDYSGSAARCLSILATAGLAFAITTFSKKYLHRKLAVEEQVKKADKPE